MKTHIRFRRIKCLWLLILLSVSNLALGQITFKLKSVVGNQNPSSNGLFAYGTLNSGNGFTQFPNYGPDGSGSGSPQWVWTYTLGQQVYPVLAFEHLDAYEITPQPFPVFGVFFHPANGLGTTVRLAVPSQMQILSITSKIQRATFGCGDNIGFQIKTASGTTIQPRVIVQTSNSPTTFNSNTATVNAGDFIYFTVDAGDDGSDWCDDTAVDVEVTLLPTKIVTPVLTGTLDCSTTSATFDVAFQQSGTLELYKLGNPSPISTASIGQVGNTFNGQGTFTGLSLSNGQYYVIAKNAGQQESAQSDLISLTTCCSNGEANAITVNNPSVCQGQIATLTATGCNGTVTWSNGITGTSTTVVSAGTYTATCTVQPTGSPCTVGTSTATGVVTINPKPTLNLTGTQCSPDLITYSVSFTSDANTITSTSGTVTSNTITNIWSGTDITITGTSIQGCKTLVNIIAPACVCPVVNAPISGGNKAICQGQTIPSLSVSVGTNETADWYDANNLLVASSTTTYTPTVAGIYNVQARNTVNSCVSSLRTAVSLTINVLPTLTEGTKVCSADLLTYSVTVTSNGTITATAGTVLGTTVTGIPSGTSVTITATSAQGCESKINVVAPSCVCPAVTAPISGGSKTICQGQTIPSLSVSVGTGETVEWFSLSAGGTAIATGLSYTPTVAGTYYAETIQTVSGCRSLSRTAVSLTINALPTLKEGVKSCSSDLLTYSVSVTSNGTITAAAGTVSGTTVTGIPSGTSVTITATSAQGCESKINVVAPSCVCPAVTAPITGGNKTICQGQTIPSLSVSVGTGETVEWFSLSAGGTAIATGLSYTPTVAGVYYAETIQTVSGCRSSSRTAVSLTINALPTLTEGVKSCSADLLTYSVSVTSNGTITATAGTVSVSGTTITGIPAGTNVTITATSVEGCESKINVVAPSCVCPVVTAPISGGSKTICQGQTIPSLSVSVGTSETVEWFSSSAGGTAIATGTSYTPTVAGTYYAETIQTVSGCRSSSRTAVSLTINALPTLTEGVKSCSADLLTYSVSVTSNGTITATAGTVSGTTVTGIPSGTSVIITATSAQSCESKINVVAPSCNCPVVNAPISGGNKTICQGQAIPSLSVSVGTGETVEWFSSSAGGTAIATGTSYTPTVAGTYYAETIQTVSGCRSSSRTAVSLTINALPTLTEGTKSCSADLLTYSVSVTSNGTITATAGTVSGTTVTGIPSGTSVTITATSAQGCESKINVVAPSCVCPVVTAPISGGSKTICQGQTIPSLSVSVGTGETVEWFSSSAGGTAVATGTSYTPTVAGMYYAETIQTVSGCRSSSRTAVSLTINLLGETPTISSSKNPLILGESATLTVSNCSGTVIWNTGENGASIVVTPSSKTTYSATCTPTTGCIGGIGQISIDVNVPTIQVKISASSICIGGSITLSMVGCPTNNIYWTSPEHGRKNEPNPTYTGITSPGTFVGHCVTTAGEATATTSVTIKTAQNLTITASKNPIYLGESVVLTAQGCNGNVSWQNGQAQGNPITVYPNDQYTTYEAECLDAASCGGKGKIIIEVKPPIITASAKDVCYGSTTTVSAKGCPNGVYYWLVWHNDSFADARSIENPNAYPITQKTHFRAVCATQAGEAAGDVTVNAIPLPNIPAIGSERTEYYLGETVTIGSGCDARTLWSTGATSTHITVKPTKAVNVYSVRCINDATGCESSNSITIYMKTPAPKVKDVILCYNEVFTTISGCTNNSTARWTKNWLDIPNRVEVSEGYSEKLTETTTYAVVCHNAETGWSESKVITVTINPKIEAPVITAKDTIIVNGDSLTLTAQGCNYTEWLDGNGNGNIMPDTLNHITVKPTKTSIYKARCYVNGCYSEWSPFKVYVRPNMPVIRTSADTLCLGSSTTITARICADGGTFHWADSTIKGLSFTITPKRDTTFKSYCVSVDSLVSDIKTTFIKVYPTPKKPTINGNLVIIEGEKTTLTASGCEESLVWSTGATSASINVNPDRNTLYSVTCGVWQCVSDTAAVLVRVRPRPIEIETSGNGSRGFNLSDTLCLNKQLTLTAITNCNGKLIWNTGDEGSKITVTGTASKVYSVYCLNPDNEKSDISTANIVVIDYDVTNAIAYPNPTSGKLYIKSKGCIDGVKLMLYSQRGEVLYEGGGQERYLDSIVLDLYHLPSDTYILYIIGNDAQNKPTILKKRIVKVNAND